jgi:hypothetical protein
LQCGGLWFVNGKVSITWNLKQAIVQKPKPSMEGKCFLKPKASDKALLKTLPPVEVIEEPDDGQVSTLVVDSDDEEEMHVSAPAPVAAPAPAPVAAQSAPVFVDVSAADETVEEVKPAAAKKKVVRKKTDA